MGGRGYDGLAGCGLNHARHDGFRHGAVMRSIAAAARRQARVVAGCEGGSERPQPEEQNEEDGESAPHLEFMVHEALVTRGFEKIDAGVRYHRGIAHIQNADERERWCLKRLLPN